jgi:hypothetical protein
MIVFDLPWIEDYMTEKNPQLLGQVTITTETMWISDPCYVIGKDSDDLCHDLMKDSVIEQIQTIPFCDLVQFSYKKGHVGLGVGIHVPNGTYDVVLLHQNVVHVKPTSNFKK